MWRRGALELLQRFLIGELQRWESLEKINKLTAELSAVALAINELK
jgi:hypothetical protein